MLYHVTAWLYFLPAPGIARPELRLVLVYESGEDVYSRRITGHDCFALMSWASWEWELLSPDMVIETRKGWRLVPDSHDVELFRWNDDLKLRISLQGRLVDRHSDRNDLWFTCILGAALREGELWAVRLCDGPPPAEFTAEAVLVVELL